MFHFSAHDFDIAIRLMAATFLGGVLGVEREFHGKEAGFRTYAMVCLGSALVMIVSIEVYDLYKSVAEVDPSRIAAQVVSGIGFIGAGAIIRFPEKIRGLTTAAGIWTVSGIGLACGIGEYRPAILSTFLALTILVVFSKIDRFLGGHDK